MACRKLGLPLTAVKGYGWHAISRERVGTATIFADGGIAVVPLGDSVIKITGGWDFDLSESYSRAQSVLDCARECIGVERVLDLKAGFRPCPPDGLPIVGRKGKVVAATGGFRLGWSFAPAMGKEAALLALEKKQNKPFLSRFWAK